MRPPTNASFLSQEVSWAPARFHAGLSFQPGWVVVRPGWVAFLPSRSSAHLVGAMVSAVAGFSLNGAETTTYDFAAASRHGPQVFDETVLQWASLHGRVLRACDGDIVKSAKGAMFRADEKTFVLCDACFPESLVADWRVGTVPFNARETAKLFAIITAIPALLGAVGGTVAYFEGESLAMICFGVGFWWALVVFGWVGYFVVHRRSKRSAR